MSDKNECIDADFVWLKSELKNLTKEERCLLLDKYDAQVQEYGIGVQEYQAFVSLFDELED